MVANEPRMRPVEASKPPSMIPTWQDKWLLTTLPSGASKAIINGFNRRALKALREDCGVASAKPRMMGLYSIKTALLILWIWSLRREETTCP